MATAVLIKDLSYGYSEDDLVLENACWELKEGNFAALVGPNGGGKTTLLKVILGMCAPLKGSVEVFGLPPDKALQSIGYVPQNLAFDRQFPISTREVVQMGRLSHLPWYGHYLERDKEAVDFALEKVALSDSANKLFGDLSGGQRQRALIARALVSEPRLLLLDEPTANVDAQAEADIHALLADLLKTMTIIMVTHDLQTAMNNVGHVVLVQRTLRLLSREEVCQHFAIGLYHPPVSKGKLHVIS